MEGPTLKRSCFNETEVFGFWMVPANYDILSGMGFSQFHRCGGDFRPMKPRNSCVQLENLYQKSDKLKRHKFPTKRRKFPTKRRKYIIILFVFNAYLDFDMLHICPCSPRCVKIKKVRKMQEWQLTRQEYRQTVETEVFGMRLIRRPWKGCQF